MLTVLIVPLCRCIRYSTLLSPPDTTILQYALTLEHLENAFYSGALAKFDQAAFTEAGLPNWVRGRFAQVASHEASHVALLQKALGDSATKPCKYEFPYTDPKSFVALSQLIEGVGTSAYIGAAKLISNKDYVTVAGVRSPNYSICKYVLNRERSLS